LTKAQYSTKSVDNSVITCGYYP